MIAFSGIAMGSTGISQLARLTLREREARDHSNINQPLLKSKSKSASLSTDQSDSLDSDRPSKTELPLESSVEALASLYERPPGLVPRSVLARSESIISNFGCNYGISRVIKTRESLDLEHVEGITDPDPFKWTIEDIKRLRQVQSTQQNLLAPPSEGGIEPIEEESGEDADMPAELRRNPQLKHSESKFFRNL